MRVHILGYGPITEHLYNLLHRNSEMFLYSERAIQVHDLNIKSYKDFVDQKIDNYDVVVMAWRELPPFGVIKREVLDFLKDNLQVNNKVIYLSSVSVYGQNATSCTEDTEPHPINIYGKSKYEIEKYLKDSIVCDLIVLRLSNVFGDSKFPDLVNKIIHSSYSRQTLELHSPAKIERDFISITSVVRCVERVLTSTSPIESYEVFNVSSGESITLETLHSLVEQVLDLKINAQNFQASEGTIILSRVPNMKFVSKFDYPIKNQIENLQSYVRQFRHVL
jgi:nucleoside-diphosphate-sugar epimerase